MYYKGLQNIISLSHHSFRASSLIISIHSYHLKLHSEPSYRSFPIILHFSPTTSSSSQPSNAPTISSSPPFLPILGSDGITDLPISLSVWRHNTINTTIMFRRLGRSVFSFATAPHSSPASPFTRFFTSPRLRPFLKTLGYGSVPAFLYYHFACLPQDDQERNEEKAVHAGPVVNPKLVENPKTFWEKVRSAIAHAIRLLHLIVIFLPPIIALPLRMFKRTEQAWLSLFVGAVERAGVVWIKAFQYLSHRRDVIGPAMAEAFTHLRENAPQHSFEETKRNFKLSYGKEIHQIFSDFDPTPIASGSVSQVYKAIYQGKKVAVKVRHPQVDKYIQRDVNILFGISRFFSLFSKAYEIPVGENSLKKTLIDQIDFNIEKENLAIFNRHFIGNQQVNFPYAFQEETRDSILIQSFVEGVPVTYFQSNKHPLNAVIARLGATTFFEMLMKNNFIHADCHGGNILVELTQQSTSFFGEIWEYIKEKCRQLEGNLLEELLESDTLRSLYKASREEEERIRGLVRQCTEKVKINLIDVGMVIKLDDTDRRNFVSFIKSVIEGNSEKCAAMIYNLSNFEGQKILEGRFSDYKTELRNLFSVLQSKSIFDIEGIQLMVGMLNIIRLHNMKLDGQFATLLTNMVVLQSIAKEIDPTIQILKCAVPYFKFVEDAPSASSIDHEKLNALMA